MDRDEVEKSSYSPRSQYVSHNCARPFYFLFLHYTTLYYSSQWASFSTCNENLIIAAPGVTIWGLDTKVRAGSDFGPYRVAGGTSMAAAHVSGIIAEKSFHSENLEQRLKEISNFFDFYLCF